MKPEDVHYIAVEGAGAGGLLVHPGALEALEALQVVRQEAFKPAGIRSWSGSSSGSVISTLASSGYLSWEIAALVSQDAFDMVFRIENIQQGEFAKIEGKCKTAASSSATADPEMAVIIGEAFSDPLGSFAELLHKTRLLLGMYIVNSQKIHREFLYEQDTRMDKILRDAEKKGLQSFKTLATETSREYDKRVNKWRSPPQNIFTLLDAEYPHLVPKLLSLITKHAIGKVKGPSIFQILKHDFGLAGGCIWRDYIDHLIAFARFRVRFGAYLPSLKLPLVEDMKVVYEIVDLFHAAIERAIQADYGTNTPLFDFFKEFNNLRHCTFAQHADELHDWPHGSSEAPPLTISAANITTRESHLFSALLTPDFHVADAVRMATGLPPLFKPMVIEAADIPGGWPIKTDRFGTAHYLEGKWIDGGLYYNAPFEVFKDASGSFTKEQNTMGLGANILDRVKTDNLTQFTTALVNLVYESNISATRVNLDNYLEIDTFDLGFEKPKILPKALEYYRLDAYWRTFKFFGIDPGL